MGVKPGDIDIRVALAISAEATKNERARIAAAIREEQDNTSEWVVESVLARLLRVVEGG